VRPLALTSATGMDLGVTVSVDLCHRSGFEVATVSIDFCHGSGLEVATVSVDFCQWSGLLECDC
jgi:hypothetical protein